MTQPPVAELTPVALRGLRERFRAEHVGLLLTLVYLFLAGVGMLHEALVFYAFRVNIIAFAEPSDFILAAFRDPLVVAVNLSALPLVWAYFSWARRRSQRAATGPRWLRGSDASRAFVARHFSTLFVAAVALYALAFSLTYASMTARRLRQGQGQHVHVELVADPAHSAADTTSMLLLGTTQKFVFLYDPARRATSVIPASNIARLVVTRGPRATVR